MEAASTVRIVTTHTQQTYFFMVFSGGYVALGLVSIIDTMIGDVHIQSGVHIPH